MPCELENSPAQSILERGIEQPLQEVHVVLPRTPVYRLLGDGELRTAAHGDHFGDRVAGQELFEGLLVDLLRRRHTHGRQLLRRRRVLHRPDFGRAANDPNAPKVHVAHLAQVGELEVLEGGEAVIVRVVVVPGEAQRVEEDEVVRQVVVVVDNVRQVHHGLAALVLGHRQRRLGVIDDVDALLPLRRQVVVEPGGVVALGAGDDDVDLARRRALLVL